MRHQFNKVYPSVAHAAQRDRPFAACMGVPFFSRTGHHCGELVHAAQAPLTPVRLQPPLPN